MPPIRSDLETTLTALPLIYTNSQTSVVGLYFRNITDFGPVGVRKSPINPYLHQVKNLVVHLHMQFSCATLLISDRLYKSQTNVS